MTVDPSVAAILKAEATVLRQPAASAAIWGARGIESSIVTPLAARADALTEAQRQIAFLGTPLVRDVVVAPGALRALVGQSVQVVCDQLGYAAGRTVFVIGARERETDTELTVLRRLEA